MFEKLFGKKEEPEKELSPEEELAEKLRLAKAEAKRLAREAQAEKAALSRQQKGR